MKRMIKASHSDSIDRSAELLDLLKENLDCETILTDLVKWMGSEEAAHALEDIANAYDLLPIESDTYSEFEEWYLGLSADDKYEVDDIADTIGLPSGKNRYASITDAQFGKLLDLFEMRKRG